MVRRRYSSASYWPVYVPVAERRRQARAFAAKRRADGCELEPVVTPGGRAITTTFWGSAWGTNLERYCDVGRLSRGRTYVRNGSVIDLRIGPGVVDAQVCGSSIYTVRIGIEPLENARWRTICDDCAGGIDSLVELLEGRFADGVMQVLGRADTGMFPDWGQFEVHCSCPDWATMCKHVVAVLLGVGVRLDQRPELLFTLRQVDQRELVARGAAGLDRVTAADPVATELDGEDLGALFGIELEDHDASAPPAPDPWITAAELRERGVPGHVFQAWLRRGLLEHSGERGIYVRTPDAEALVRSHVAQRAR